jgi:tetratricopeptide (TPR) repeat protein
MSLNAANLREFEELRRIKEDRILLTMLQVEKSHVPFPDEPPVEFPPAATWRTLTALRKDKYDAVGLEGPAARNALRIRDKLLQPASIEKPIEGLPLKDVLDFLSEKYELTFIVDLQAFDRIGKKTVEDEQVRLPKMPGVALGTILRFILSQVNGSLIIRRDYVEITTVDQTILEKAVRAYPVADLVIPIPNGVNQQVLNQNLQILGGSLSANGQAIFGAAGGGQALGFNGALGALGVLGPLGALGAAGAGLGGAAGIGGGAAGAGATGAGFQGALGFAGGNNQTNLGFGGGVLGFGGGQQGQFGNLGGQFGIQGGDTSAILVELIQDVIAPKEWQKRAALYLLNNVNTQVEENEQPILNPDQLNSLGYYQPARALVVRATSRIQTRIGGAISGVRPGGNAQGNKKDNGEVLVINPGDRNNRGNQNPDLLAKAKAETKPVDPAPKAFVMGDLKPKDLQDAVEKGLLKPRQVIAVADVLAIGEKFEEAASFLKANLRQGILVDPCVFDALALALQTSGAAPEEIERVRMSQIDMEPKNPQAYLSAAKGMHELGRHEQAVALCKRAAAIEPNAADAYADSLAYLVKAKDVDTDAVEWATGNLLRRDWAIDQSPLQAQAQQAIQAVIAKLKASGRTSEAQRLETAVHGQAQRDLVIELLWSDPADLDLEVTEPTGAICSPTIPQSTGGGIWHGDQVLAQDRTKAYQETYVAAEAFTGSYEIRVRTVWGKPMGGKATIRLTRHQGTPNQSQELHRIEFGADGIANLKVRLDDGRRTEITSVPPPAARRVVATTGTSPDRVFNLLRSMSEPAFNASSKTPIAGGTSASGAMTTQAMDFTPDIGPEIIHQNKLLNTTNTGTDLQGSATVSSDRKSIRWSLSPVFQTATSEPEVNLTTIPGGK